MINKKNPLETGESNDSFLFYFISFYFIASKTHTEKKNKNYTE